MRGIFIGDFLGFIGDYLLFISDYQFFIEIPAFLAYAKAKCMKNLFPIEGKRILHAFFVAFICLIN